jgi:lysyl-tRNA synthetase class 1
MFQSPRRAKRLYFDVIPRQVDEYLSHLRAFEGQDAAARLANPVWHIHDGNPPAEKPPLNFGLLLNLASVCNTEDKAVLWGFVSRYAAGAGAEDHPILDTLIGHAIAYYRDFVKPAKHYRAPNDMERAALMDLSTALGALPAGAAAEAIQNEVYEVGKRHPFEDLRAWFRALYEILLGQSEGPRMGSFIALYGRDESIALIARALAGDDLAAG